MQYEVIGDMPAPTFFDINQDTGTLKVKSSLKLDDKFEYTVNSCIVNLIDYVSFFTCMYRSQCNEYLLCVLYCS